MQFLHARTPIFMTKLCKESGKLPKTSDHQTKFVDPQKFDFFIPSYPLLSIRLSIKVSVHLYGWLALRPSWQALMSGKLI